MARSLDQILTELNSVYAPQKDLYNQQLNTLDPQMDAEQKGLQAQQQDSFSQITNGANRRGLLFSGIPLQEQAQYTGQSFLPAVANLKAKYAQQRFNLQDALAKINQSQQRDAYDIYGNELSQDAARLKASSGGLGGFNLGGGTSPTAATTGVQKPADYDVAYRSAQQFLALDDNALLSDYRATLDSANRGNAMDKIKIQLYQQARPDLFRSNTFGGTSNTPLVKTSLPGSIQFSGSGPSYQNGQTVYTGTF